MLSYLTDRGFTLLAVVWTIATVGASLSPGSGAFTFLKNTVRYAFGLLALMALAAMVGTVLRDFSIEFN